MDFTASEWILAIPNAFLADNCTNALLAIQHQTYKYLDSSDCSALRIFAMDFSKAFDFVNHTILAAKLKQTPKSVHYQLLSEFPLCKTTTCC